MGWLKSDTKRFVQKSIKDDNFWEKVDAILKILQPVANLIYSSKSNRVYVERTYQNWLDFENHFKSVELSGFLGRKELMRIFFIAD